MVHSASFSRSVYSFSLSTATMFVSTSETIRINQLRIWVIESAYERDKPERKNASNCVIISYCMFGTKAHKWLRNTRHTVDRVLHYQIILRRVFTYDHLMYPLIFGENISSINNLKQEKISYFWETLTWYKHYWLINVKYDLETGAFPTKYISHCW